MDTTTLDAYNIVDLRYAKVFGEGRLTASFLGQSIYLTLSILKSPISPKEETSALV